MPSAKAEKLLRSAARPAIEQIRHDRGRVPKRLKPLLDHFARHLFDPKLKVSRARRACGLRDNSCAIHFREALGIPPLSYILERRMETAVELLQCSTLPIGQIGQLVGFRDPGRFNKRFRQWSGQSPTEYRLTHPALHGPAEPRSRPLPHHAKLRRALTGGLPAEEAATLVAELRTVGNARAAAEQAARDKAEREDKVLAERLRKRRRGSGASIAASPPLELP